MITNELTFRYIEWRKAGEKAANEAQVPFTWDCGESSAREDFSNWCKLDTMISFEQMLKLELDYANSNIKTLDGWTAFSDATGNGNWCEYASPGDEVSEDIFDNFLDVLPPARYTGNYLQVGEPYSHRKDESGEIRPTFATFTNEGSKYFYIGHCFLGEQIHRD